MTAPQPPGQREAAHQYLERGFMPVGWVPIDGRKAAVSMKGRHYDDLEVTHAEIDNWKAHWQVGLAMCQRSGFWALDLDCGPERAEEFHERHVVTRSAINLTARGFHLVYRGAGGCPWPRDGVWSADWLDVQVRSNGFIGVWPSIHPSGVPYRWLDSHLPVEPGSMLLGYRPERAPRHLGRGSERNGDGPNGDLAFYEEHGIPVGWQDTEIYRLACAHVRTMNEVELCDRLWSVACASAQNQMNPWRPEDIAAKVRRAGEFTSAEDAAVRAAVADWKAARP